MSLAAALFADLGKATRVGRGIVRDSYGAGEQAGHDLVRTAAAALGLEISIDAIGNAHGSDGHGHSRRGILLVRHLLHRQQRRIWVARPAMPGGATR